MSFWETVDAELKYNGMTRKALAQDANFSLVNIGKGIKLGSSPSADTAVRIAKVLGVTVEYLVTGTDSATGKGTQTHLQQEMELFRQYRAHVETLSKLHLKERTAVIHLAEELGKE